jgi:hypothetical protein
MMHEWPVICRFRGMMRLIGVFVLFFGLVSCSHDTARVNPLDPQLIPAPHIAVVAHDTAGVVVVEWSRFESRTEFALYRVVRRQLGLDRSDTISVMDVSETSYSDSTVAHGESYEYTVTAVNASGLEAGSLRSASVGIRLPVADIHAVQMDAATAAARISWHPYEGTRFAAYEVERADGASVQIIAEITQQNVTTSVDSSLKGDTEYRYRIITRTGNGERIAGRQWSGAFHGHVANWPLDLGDLTDPNVRLYAMEDGTIEVLLGHSGGAMISQRNVEGGEIEKTEILDLIVGLTSGRSVATTPRADGGRFLSVIGREGIVRMPALLQADEMGDLVWEDEALFVDELSVLTPRERVVGGQVVVGVSAYGNGFVDSVSLTAGEEILIESGFGGARLDSLGFTAGNGIWHVTNPSATKVVDHRLRLAPGFIYRSDSSWQDFAFESQMSFNFGTSGLGIGGQQFPGSSGFSLHADANGQTIDLQWDYWPEDGAPIRQVFSVDHPLVPGVPYRLRLEAAHGQVSAIIRSSARWHGQIDDGHTWTNLATIDGRPTVVVDEQPYVLSATGEGQVATALESWISEIRVWDGQDGDGQAIGVCHPAVNQVLLTAPLRGRSTLWPRFLRRQLGPFTDGGGSLSYPVSFDVGPDGRTYVLDAGNSRVVVFDAADQYLTQWGGAGSASGEFDFGDARPLRDRGFNLAGSIAVDDDGFIYVADVGNQRIQKFAP